MDDLMSGLIGVVIGYVLFIAFYVAVYCYRDMVFKKEAIKRNKSKGFVAMRLYREHVKAERERGLKNHD